MLFPVPATLPWNMFRSTLKGLHRRIEGEEFYLQDVAQCSQVNFKTFRRNMSPLSSGPKRLASVWFLLASSMVDTSALKIKVNSSKTSGNSHRTSRRSIPEDRTLHSYCCENITANRIKWELSWSFTMENIKFCHSTAFHSPVRPHTLCIANALNITVGNGSLH